MGRELLEFFNSQNIEIALEPSGEQDGVSIPRYNVSLRKGEKEESFVIFGDSETEQRMTPEDALRAIFIRVRLHENKVELSSGLDMLCCETATKLMEFLGPDNYSNFLNLQTSLDLQNSTPVSYIITLDANSLHIVAPPEKQTKRRRHAMPIQRN